MKTTVYRTSSKPEGRRESGVRKVRLLGPAEASPHQNPPNPADNPYFVPTNLRDERSGLAESVDGVGGSVARLAKLVKPNRRNGGGPRSGRDFSAVDLEKCRARFDVKWTPEPNTGCWLWFGAACSRGYGCFAVTSTRNNLRVAAAHRVAYLLNVGPIAPGMTLDHLCRNPACVNPSHMEQVTIEENVARANRHRQLISVCMHGHSLGGSNLYVNPHGRRTCRACRNASKQRLALLRAASAECAEVGNV